MTAMAADPDQGQRIGRRAYADPHDQALRQLHAAALSAVAAGARPDEVLGRVVCALTGRLNGPIERTLTKELVATYDAVRALEGDQ